MKESEMLLFYLLYSKELSTAEDLKKQIVNKFNETVKYKNTFDNKIKRYEQYCTQCDVLKSTFNRLNDNHKALVYYGLSLKEESLKDSGISDDAIRTTLKEWVHDYLYILRNLSSLNNQK